MRTIRRFLGFSAALLLLGQAHADDQVMRYHLKAPVIFSSGATDPDDGPPDHDPNDNGSQLSIFATGGEWRVLDHVSVPVTIAGAQGAPSVVVSPDPSAFGLSYGSNALTGQPLAPFVQTFDFDVVDGAGRTAETNAQVVVNPALSASMTSSISVQSGASVSLSPHKEGLMGTPTWGLSAGTLPSGLSLSTETGAITGTAGAPTTASGLQLSLADDHDGASTVTNPFAIQVVAPAIVITAPDRTLRSSAGLSFTVSATGGYGPLSASISGLPAGLTASTAGAVSASAAPAAGTYPLVVGFGNEHGSATRDMVLTVVPALSAAFQSTYTVQAGVSANINPTAVTGKIGNLTYALAPDSAPLPAGMALNGPTGTGVIYNGGTQPGTYPGIKLRVTDSADGASYTTSSFSIVVATPPIAIAATGGTYHSNGIANIPVSITGGYEPTTTVSVSGLPSGMAWYPNTKTIQATGTIATGTHTVTIGATDGYSTAPTKSITIVVTSNPIAIAYSSSSYSAFTGTAFSTGNPIVNHNVGTPTWSYTGTLPDGLGFNTATGVISGTPTTVESRSLTITATDSDGTTATASTTIGVSTIANGATSSNVQSVVCSTGAESVDAINRMFDGVYAPNPSTWIDRPACVFTFKTAIRATSVNLGWYQNTALCSGSTSSTAYQVEALVDGNWTLAASTIQSAGTAVSSNWRRRTIAFSEIIATQWRVRFGNCSRMQLSEMDLN